MQLVGTGLRMVLMAFALGCSSGGSDGSAAMSDTTPDAVVGVVLTDAPSDDVEQVIATFTRIEFVGPGGIFTVFEGAETVDLLDLSDAYELFTVTTLAPGSFDLVRFGITDVSIVSEADDGSLVTKPVTLSSSTIDVALPGGFTIAEGQVLFLEVDFDVDKALELMVEDGSGELTLQPLIFIEIDDNLPSFKFARVHGQVDELTDVIDTWITYKREREDAMRPEAPPVRVCALLRHLKVLAPLPLRSLNGARSPSSVAADPRWSPARNRAEYHRRGPRA